MSSYNALEQQPLLQPTSETAGITQKYRKCQERTGHILQTPFLHTVVLALIVLDATFVVIDLGYLVLHPECQGPAENPAWLEILSHLSLGITSLFLVEIPLTIWSLGFQYMNPFGPLPHAWLHCFDAVIIVTTFVLEVVFRGTDESELAGLLIIFRLWRIVKLVAGVAVGAGEVDEELAEELHDTRQELEQTRAELATSREQNIKLQLRLAASGEPAS